MIPEILGYILALVYGLFCIALGLLSYKFGLSKKYSRKIVHILVSFEWVILYHFMGASIHFLAVCLAFTALLLISHLKNLLPAMSSDGDNAPGTVYYGVAMSIMAAVSLFVDNMIIPFGIGVFCTSFGDGFAGLIGQLVKKHNPKIFNNKSLYGTAANFVFCFLAAFSFREIFDLKLSLLHCVLIAVFGVGLELIGIFGLDNIFVTLGTALLAYGFIYSDWVMDFIVPILLTPFVIVLVKEKRALTSAGLVIAMIMDLAVSLTLANFGFTLLLSFLVGSVLIDKIKKKKKATDHITKKGECRDEIQVIANGFVPTLLAVMFAYTGEYVFVVAYVAALAEAFADTAASGFGVFSKSTFDLFKWKRCECGLSGGMSLVGTLASLLAAFLFSLLALAFGVADIYIVILASLAAFLGVVFDSFLGSLLQVKYKCPVCGIITEKEEHCEVKTERHSGFAFFDNDVVNLFSGVFSAVVAIVAYSLIA